MADQVRTLTEAESALWDDGGHEGDEFRRSIREWAAGLGCMVEIFSSDGICLDWIPKEDDEPGF